MRMRIYARELNKSWQCAMCNGVYSILPILVIHIRSAHSHEPGLCFPCGVDMCPRTFKNTNTYYKHVRNDHRDKYAAGSSVGNKSLLSANIYTPNSVNSDSNKSSGSDTVTVTSDLVENSDDNVISIEHDDVTSDTTKVASGHLIQLKCKAGVTQSILPSIVEMNEAVVDSVLDNVSSKVAERLQANGIGPEERLATDLQEIIESHRNPLRSLRTVYCQNSVIEAHYPMVVSIHVLNM